MKSTVTRRYPDLAFLLAVYGLGILFFTAFRVLLLSLHQKDILHFGSERHWLVAQAFWMGFRFDTVIACYLLVLPMLILGLLATCGWLRPWALRAGYFFVGAVFIGAFALCAIDIPFYGHFFRRLDDTVFAWKEHSLFGFKMILQDHQYWWYFLALAFAASCYLLGLRQILRLHLRALALKSTPNRWRYIPIMLTCCGLFLLGMRGRVSAKTPILAGAAYFCDDPTINALGLNPVFTLIRTSLDAGQPENQRLNWIDDQQALKVTSSLLNTAPLGNGISPIARQVTPRAPLKGRNVVLIIMESMSSAKMQRFGSKENLTPFLDSLAAANWSFDNIWSAGIHTYNGIYSTLMGHPALMKKHPMEVVAVPQIAGFPSLLRRQGYQTLFATTHDELFDNMSGFLSANGIERIIGQKDYPAGEVKSTMGVPDEFMFRYTVPELSKMAAKGRAFFAAFMTGSDHDPIIIPTETGFTPRHKGDKYKMSVEYADWSLRRFMQYAAAQPWYANTLFVFVADHGCLWGENKYDVAFSYQHIPLIFFAPGYTSPKVFSQLGLQTDVPATVMGLVGKPYTNNILSEDLQTTHRPYAIFSSDSRLACMSDSLLYVYRQGPEAKPSLYHYRDGDLTDYYDTDSAYALPMRTAAFAWLQTSQWLIEHKKAGWH